MSSYKMESLCRELGAASSSLRRISYFSQDSRYEQRTGLISRFLEDCRPAMTALARTNLPAYQESSESLRKNFLQLVENFPKDLELLPKRLTWSEEAMTLSLRLFHLSEALSKPLKNKTPDQL